MNTLRTLNFISKHINDLIFIELATQVLDTHVIDHPINPADNTMLKQDNGDYNYIIIVSNYAVRLVALPDICIKHLDLNTPHQLLDKIQTIDGNITYLLCDEQKYTLVLINPHTQLIESYTANMFGACFDQLKITELVDPELLLFDAIIHYQQQVYTLSQGIYETTIIPIDIVLHSQTQLLRVSTNSILLSTGNDNYFVTQNITLTNIQASIQMVYQFMDQIYLISNKLDNQSQIFQLNLNTNQVNILEYDFHISGIYQYDSIIKIYSFSDYTLQISDLQCSTAQFITFKCTQIKKVEMLSHQQLIILTDSAHLYHLFKPDYEVVIKQLYNIDNAVIKPSQLINTPNESALFTKVKKTKQNIDDMMAIALKYSYIKVLLLLNARIRVFTTFFTQIVKMSESNNEIPVKELANLQILKQCECFENSYILEEFIVEFLKFAHHVVMIYFQNLLIENPNIVPQQFYYQILQMKYDRQCYQDRQLELPKIPASALRRSISDIQFMNQARMIFHHDYYSLKADKINILNQGMIGNIGRCFGCQKIIQAGNNKNQVIKYHKCHHAFHSVCHTVPHQCDNKRKCAIQ